MFSRQDVFSRMRLIAAIAMWSLSAGMLVAEEPSAAEPKPIPAEESKRLSSPREQAAVNCEKIYGNSVNFRRPELATVLTLVSPAPFEERVALEGKSIDERLRKWQRTSFTRDWFAQKWLPDGKAPEPIAYHFRSPDQPLLGSTVYYEWKIQSVTFRATETSCGLLVEIKDPQLDPREGVPYYKVERLLKDVFKIPDDEQEFPGSGKFRRVNLVKLFKLPKVICEGTIFGSQLDQPHFSLDFQQWYHATMGFATKDSICIVIWRPNGPGHLGQKGRHTSMVGKSGLFEDPTWLDGEIFEADGKTRVKVPSLAPAAKTSDH